MLRNRTEKEENLLRGVNLIANPTKLTLGYFASLQNWIPAKKYKVKKKRGPTRLSSDPQTVDPITLGFGTLVNCETTTPPGVVGTCVGCLTIDPADGTIIAKSAALTVPCFCFYAPQICNTNIQFAKMTFKGIIAGNPRSGVVVRVPTSATDTSFTGYVLLYDPGHATQKFKIVKYVTASLQTIGTVLASSNTTLVANNVIELWALAGVGNDVTLSAFINNAMIINANESSPIDNTNSGVGIVVVGNTGADDRMRWDDLEAGCKFTGSTSTQCSTIFDFISEWNPVPSSIDLCPPLPIGCAIPGCSGDDELDHFIDTSSEINVSSGPGCYGVHYIDMFHYKSLACPTHTLSNLSVIFGNFSTGGQVTGAGQRTGITFGIQNGDIENFTGLAAIYDNADQTIKVVSWSNQPLSDYGTILASQTLVSMGLPVPLPANFHVTVDWRSDITVSILAHDGSGGFITAPIAFPIYGNITSGPLGIGFISVGSLTTGTYKWKTVGNTAAFSSVFMSGWVHVEHGGV